MAKPARELEQLARYVAVKGKTEAARLLAIVERAQELLADPDFQATITEYEKAARRVPFDWETEEEFPLRTRASLYLGSVEDFATGEGLTIHFAAAFARSESEFRRIFAAKRGVGLADRLWVGRGVEAQVPFMPLFVSPAFWESLRDLERGERPAVFRFFAEHHANFA
jgi:hypothetical protein